MEQKIIDLLGATNEEYKSINEVMKNFEVGAIEVLDFWRNDPAFFSVNNFIYAIYKIVSESLNLHENEFSLYCNNCYSKFLYNNRIVNNKAELIAQMQLMKEVEV